MTQPSSELRPVTAQVVEAPRIAGIEPDDIVVVLDPVIDMLRLLRDARQQAKLVDKLEAQLSDIMGSGTIGLVGGKVAVRRRPTKTFRGGDFKKLFPQLAKLYTIKVEKEEYDLNLLEKAQPDIWNQFRSRPFVLTFDE